MPYEQKSAPIEWLDDTITEATFVGNNAAWLCCCGRRLPLLGVSLAPTSEAVSVECPECARIFAVVGEYDKGPVVLVRELRQASPPSGGFTITSSGVNVFADFRANLIVDADDPALERLRAKKLEHLRSENSEDALTWNVFRTLEGCGAEWLPRLFQVAFPGLPRPDLSTPTCQLWPSLKPPPALALAGYREGASEIDVLIEGESFVWIIKAKYTSDISLRTTYYPGRDQIVRNIDVGSHFAGQRPFYFSLLILDEARSPAGKERIESYAASRETRLRLLGHRDDVLQNLRGIGLLTWFKIASVLLDLSGSAGEEIAQRFQRALGWLSERNIRPMDEKARP